MGRLPSEDEIRRIYRETIDPLYAFVSLRCDGDRDLAEDITQETWLRALRAWRDVGVPERPLAWLSTVAARLVSNHRRRKPSESLDEQSADVIADAEPDRMRLERRTLVERAMARLPLPQLRLLEAFHFDRRPVGEIASAMRVSERGVEGRLRRARQRLRQIIESDPDIQKEQDP